MKSKDGLAEQLKSLLTQLLKPTQKEPSCLKVSLYQDENNPHLFIFHEVWFDDYGFECHKDQAYVKEFLTRSKDLLAGEINFHRMRLIKALEHLNT